jgi:nitronate monooxygenase
MQATDFTELVGVTLPIIQAPMAGVATPELVAAVANAGGLGSLGCATLSSDEVRARVGAVRDLTSDPINTNFFANAHPQRDGARDQAAQRLLAPY